MSFIPVVLKTNKKFLFSLSKQNFTTQPNQLHVSATVSSHHQNIKKNNTAAILGGDRGP